MTVSHRKSTGKTTITLDWTETRQFMSDTTARNVAAQYVREAVNLTLDPLPAVVHEPAVAVGPLGR